jgi:hypothetical protein
VLLGAEVASEGHLKKILKSNSTSKKSEAPGLRHANEDSGEKQI